MLVYILFPLRLTPSQWTVSGPVGPLGVRAQPPVVLGDRAPPDLCCSTDSMEGPCVKALTCAPQPVMLLTAVSEGHKATPKPFTEPCSSSHWLVYIKFINVWNTGSLTLKSGGQMKLSLFFDQKYLYCFCDFGKISIFKRFYFHHTLFWWVLLP